MRVDRTSAGPEPLDLPTRAYAMRSLDGDPNIDRQSAAIRRQVCPIGQQRQGTSAYSRLACKERRMFRTSPEDARGRPPAAFAAVRVGRRCRKPSG